MPFALTRQKPRGIAMNFIIKRVCTRADRNSDRRGGRGRGTKVEYRCSIVRRDRLRTQFTAIVTARLWNGRQGVPFSGGGGRGQTKPWAVGWKKFDQYPIELRGGIRNVRLIIFEYARAFTWLFAIGFFLLSLSPLLPSPLFPPPLVNLFPFAAGFCFRFKAQSTTRNVILR